MKRIFDIVFSFIGIIILLPIFILISLIILFDSKGGIFYRQTRVGKNNKDFKIFKFRTMYPDSDKKGLLTVGSRDNRITKPGYFLRKYKLDELPQLFNVFIGDMSFVGPRPEVRKYVEMYNDEQKKVLSVRPGITDYASIEYRNENDILAKSKNPEQTYIKEIMPAKLELNLKYIREKSTITDLKIIFKTILKIFN
ncbi:MAG: sugar transferase [Bacteroidales bacterium]|jgi:lipopolysaccharide/colanic/teichoic acid biosynthesis glycosyltransferase|nr:sugar transferase [Bacteroidales bacterium]HOL97441.1 sugar transferase [Bacteroidales bacterium]HOM36039.1 sugar transferase [Bacteroidales bacterium]HPD23349.1 sugar transferase [Bacteroidales bacterium]HRS99715.1 sugar transferase [Bacteroidales bacterium]